MTEIRFHPGDSRRRVRTLRVRGQLGHLFSLALLSTGTIVVLGLAGAPDLVSFVILSADRVATWERAARGREALAAVTRRHVALAKRLAADELFLARVASLTKW